MREVCYCGRTGEVESREPVLNNDGRRALRCPKCGHTDRLEWLPKEARARVFEEAEWRSEQHGSPKAA